MLIELSNYKEEPLVWNSVKEGQSIRTLDGCQPVESCYLIISDFYIVTLSNFKKITVSPFQKFQTEKGFKSIEIGDIIITTKKVRPIVIDMKKTVLKDVFLDIYLKSPIVSYEGYILKCSVT